MVKKWSLRFLFTGVACSGCTTTVGRAPCLQKQDYHFTVSGSRRCSLPAGVIKYGLGLQVHWLFREWSARWIEAAKSRRECTHTVVRCSSAGEAVQVGIYPILFLLCVELSPPTCTRKVGSPVSL